MKSKRSFITHVMLPMFMGFQFHSLPAWAENTSSNVYLTPQTAAAFYRIQANELFAAKQYDDAVTYYTRAIAQDPEDLEAYLKRGLAYQQLDEYYKAIGDFSDVIVLDRNTKVNRPGPYNIDAYLNRGYSYLVVRDFEPAMKDFDTSIVINPFDKRCYMMKGLTLVEQGRAEDAMNQFNIAIAFDGQYTEAYLNRGSLYIKKGDYEKAIEDYSHAVKFNQNPEDDRAFRLRAMAYRHLANQINGRAQADLKQDKAGGK